MAAKGYPPCEVNSGVVDANSGATARGGCGSCNPFLGVPLLSWTNDLGVRVTMSQARIIYTYWTTQSIFFKVAPALASISHNAIVYFI